MEIQLRQQQNDIFIMKLHIDLIYHKIYEWQTILQVYVNKDINYTNVNTCLTGNQYIPMSVFLPYIFHLPATHHRSAKTTTTFYHWSYDLFPLEKFHLLPWNTYSPGIRLTPPIVGIETSVILSLPECSIAIPYWCAVIHASPCCLLFIVGSFRVRLFIKIGGCRRFGETFWLLFYN